MAGDEAPFDGERCWAMLAASSFGRVALSVHALPVVIPVRYRVRGRVLRVQPARMTPVGDGLAGSVVAFEADGFDIAAQLAWTVHAIGRVEPLELLGSRRAEAFDIHPMIIDGRWLAFDDEAP